MPKPLVELIQAPEFQNPCWIEPAILPKSGKLLLGGEAKIGKSFICLELARALAIGGNPFQWNTLYVPQAARVLYIDQELGEYGLQLRAKKIFSDWSLHALIQDKLFYVSKDPDILLSKVSGRQRLEDYIDEVQPNVVILDPIGKLHAHEENSSTEISLLFNYFDHLTRKYKELELSIVIVHHFRKPLGDVRFRMDPLSPYNFGGSRKWYDDPDSLITIKREGRIGQGWYIKMRFETRQGKPPDDAVFTVNQDDDGRVKFHSMAEGELPRLGFAEGGPSAPLSPTPAESRSLPRDLPETRGLFDAEGSE